MLDQLRFIRALVTKRRETGAIGPSSRRLGRAMVDQLESIEPGDVIVELGPGTGVFTREILNRFPNNPVVAIENNTNFVCLLQKRLPEAQVVHGCASQISQAVRDAGHDPKRICAVLSGLPLLTLPADLGSAIFAELANVLDHEQPYIQFTYSRRAWRRFDPVGFHQTGAKLVMRNMPPAWVLSFKRQQEPVAVAV